VKGDKIPSLSLCKPKVKSTNDLHFVVNPHQASKSMSKKEERLNNPPANDRGKPFRSSVE
jgi:hypothetical protein